MHIKFLISIHIYVISDLYCPPSIYLIETDSISQFQDEFSSTAY